MQLTMEQVIERIELYKQRVAAEPHNEMQLQEEMFGELNLDSYPIETQNRLLGELR